MPVERHRGEQVVLREAPLHVSVAVTPGSAPFDDPGGEPHRRVVERERERLGVGGVHRHVARDAPCLRRDLRRPVALGLGVVVAGDAAVVEAQQAGHALVHADHPLRGEVPDRGGHERAPVAAVGGVAGVAQHLVHQRVPQRGDLGEADAGAGERRREAEAGQRRHHHVEGVVRIAAVGGRVAERADHVLEVPEGPRPAVAQHQGDRLRTLAARVQVVDRNAVERDAMVLEGVHARLVRAPVVPIAPVADEFGQEVAVHPVAPVGVAEIGAGAPAYEPFVQVGELGVGNGDLEAFRRGAHGCVPPIGCTAVARRRPEAIGSPHRAQAAASRW